MDGRVYWIWAQHAFGAGSPMAVKIAGQYAGGLQEFCEGGPKLWNVRRDLKDAEAAALRDFSKEEAEARLEYAEKVGWQVFVPESGEYPELLKNIPNPPAVLYVKGKMPDLDHMVSVAVVGSRKPLPASEGAAWHFGNRLALGRACVVSGGAEGVDAAALTGALRVPGAQMISVLPVSLDSSYIQKNSRLRSMICERGGALVTEYFSQQHPVFGTFQVRNRLITGLSRGVVIVQAARKSGSIIYASHALDQNRDVFVFPGPEGSAEFSGSSRLIADGAKAVTSGEDVLEEYGLGERASKPDPQVAELFRELVVDHPRKKEHPALALADVGAGLSPTARRVWESLGREPLSVAQLSEKTGVAPAVLLGLLTELELDGLAQSHPGKRYTLGHGS